jgi:hypothetical protein
MTRIPTNLKLPSTTQGRLPGRPKNKKNLGFGPSLQMEPFGFLVNATIDQTTLTIPYIQPISALQIRDMDENQAGCPEAVHVTG